MKNPKISAALTGRKLSPEHIANLQKRRSSPLWPEWERKRIEAHKKTCAARPPTYKLVSKTGEESFHQSIAKARTFIEDCEGIMFKIGRVGLGRSVREGKAFKGWTLTRCQM